MASSPLFWKLIHRRYVRSPVADPAVYARKLELTQARLRPDWHLLEIGCGSGNTALAHAPHVAQVTATDFCDDMMDHGRARAAAEGIGNITFECKRLEDFSGDQSYDAVLMHSILHLIPDWRGAVARAARLTRRGGIFVSSTPCLKDLRGPIRALAPILRATPLLPSLAAIARTELTSAMLEDGFVIEESWKPGGSDAVFIIARRI